MEGTIAFGTGISLRLPSEWSMYLSSPGMANPKIFLRRRESNKPMLSFDRSVFKFVPAHASAAIASSAKKNTGSSGGNSSSSSSVPSSGPSTGLDQVGSRVTYGRPVHLVHVYSGLYVTIVRKPSETNTSNFRVVLMAFEDAGSACRFKILPRYKIRVEGDTVCDGDMIYLQAESSPLSLHATALTGSNNNNNNADQDISSLLDESQAEVNAAETATPMEVVVYDDTIDSGQRHPVLSAGIATILFHREKDAIFTIPTAISEELRKQSTSKRTSSRRVTLNVGASSPTKATAGGSQPHDSPRSKLVPYFEHLDTAVATLSVDHFEYGCNSLWIFENLDPTVGGRILTSAPCRIRHGATGRYLLAQQSLTTNNFELVLVHLSTQDQYSNSLFELDLVSSSVSSNSSSIFSSKSFVRVKHRATGMFISTAKTTPHGSSVLLSPSSNLEDTLAVVICPKSRQQELSFLIGNVEFLATYINLFYSMQDPSCVVTPRDAQTGRVVTQATQSLSALIRFCTSSEDEDPLTREGLPISDHQQAMFEVSLHKTAMEVLLCPFVSSTKQNKMELPLSGGVLSMEEVLKEDYANIHMVCRLCYRLLKQMSKGSPFAALLVEYVGFMQAQEGYKLHVADTLMEIFTDNPNIPPSRAETDIRHFIQLLLNKGRSSGYLKFLSRLCVVKETGVLVNQRLVSKLVLETHRESILLQTEMKNGNLQVLVPGKKSKDKSAPPPTPTWQVMSQFLVSGDAKLIKFMESSIELLASLSLGGDPICIQHVKNQVSMDHILVVLDHHFPCSGGLRASYFALALHCFLRDILQESVGSSTKRTYRCGSLVVPAQHKTEEESPSSSATTTEAVAGENAGTPKEEQEPKQQGITPEQLKFLQQCKEHALQVMIQHRNSTGDFGCNDLISNAASIWHSVVMYQRYDPAELASAVGAVIGVLDGRTDKVASNERYVCNEQNGAIMKTKRRLCDFLSVVLDNEVGRIADHAVSALISSGAETAVSQVETMVTYLTVDVFHARELFPALLDLLMYQDSQLVSQAFELLVAVCNVGGSVTKRVAGMEIVTGENNIRAFQCFCNVQQRLERNMSVSGNILNEQAVLESIYELITFDPLSTTSPSRSSEKLKEKEKEKSSTEGQIPSPSSKALGRLQAKVNSIMAMKRVWGNVVEKRNKWRSNDQESVGYAAMLLQSDVHLYLISALEKATHGSELHSCLLRFFRVLSAAPESARTLSKNLSLFVDALKTEQTSTDAACIILRLLRNNKSLAQDLSEDTIVQFVALLGFASDPAIAEGLEHVVLGEFPIPKNQRLVLTLLINTGLTKTVPEVSSSWPALQLAFNSAVVDLIACCCVGNSSCRSIASRVLKASDLMRVLMLDLPNAHRLPYFKFLCSAFLCSEDDWTAQELQQLRKKWTDDPLWWSLVNTVMIPKLSLISVDGSPDSDTDELVFSGIVPAFANFYLNHYCPVAARKSKVAISLSDVVRRFTAFAEQSLQLGEKLNETYICTLYQALRALDMHAKIQVSAEVFDTFSSATRLVHELNISQQSKRRITESSPERADEELGSNASFTTAEEHFRILEGARSFTAKWQSFSQEALRPLTKLLCGNRPLNDVPEHLPNLVSLHQKIVDHLHKWELSEEAAMGALAAMRYAALELEQGEGEESKAFVQAQVYLNSIGVLQMITEVVSNSSEAVANEAFSLAIANLEGGNTVVQDSLLNHFNTNDERFFHDIHNIISGAIRQAQQFRAREMHSTFYNTTQRAKLQFRYVLQAFRFLQLMCEGHHLGLQNYLREQMDNLRSVNVVKEVTQFLEELVGDHLDLEHTPLLLQSLALLTEFCQGPCKGNQQLIVDSGTCTLLNRLLTAPGFDLEEPVDFSEEKSESLLQIKRAAITTILSLLEGCIDEQIPLLILNEVPVSGLASFLEKFSGRPEFVQGTCDDLCEIIYSIVITLHTLVQCVKSTTNRNRIAAQQVLEAHGQCVGMLGLIEIERNDRIEMVYFRVPTICSLLSEENKQKLLWSVDRSTQGSKLSDFLDKADELIFDMEATHRVNERLRSSSMFKVLTAMTIAGWDNVTLGLAALMNLLFVVVLEDARGLMDSSTEWLGIEGMIRMLAYAQLFSTTMTAILDGILNLPLLLYKQSKKDTVNVSLVRKTRAIVTRPQTIYRALAVFFSMLGCFYSEFFFAAHLLGFIAKSSVLKNVIVAVTQNGKSLLLTALLGTIIVYLFSIIGFVLFQDHFENACGTLSQCVVHILATGLRQGGGIGDAMTAISYEHPNYYWRLVYDITFWAFMIVIFLNILFGIIIDTFAELRDEKSKKEEDMRTKCFVCGIDSYTFDRYGEGFEKHVKVEHNMWQYLYFLHHLRRKEKSEYTGQESYVSELAALGDISFFPAGKCSSLRDVKTVTVEGDEGNEENAVSVPHGKDGSGRGGAGGSSGGPGDLTDAAAIAARGGIPNGLDLMATQSNVFGASQSMMFNPVDNQTMQKVLTKLDTLSQQISTSSPRTYRNRGLSSAPSDGTQQQRASNEDKSSAAGASSPNTATYGESYGPGGGDGTDPRSKEQISNMQVEIERLQGLVKTTRQELFAQKKDNEQSHREAFVFYNHIFVSAFHHVDVQHGLYNEYILFKANLLREMYQQSLHTFATTNEDLSRVNSLLSIQLDGMRAQKEQDISRGLSSGTADGGHFSPGSGTNHYHAQTYAHSLEGLMREGDTYMQLLRSAVREGRAIYNTPESNHVSSSPPK